MLSKKYEKKQNAIFIIADIPVLVFILAWELMFKSITFAWKPTPSPTGMNSNFMTHVDDCFLSTAKVIGYDLLITANFRSLAVPRSSSKFVI